MKTKKVVIESLKWKTVKEKPKKQPVVYKGRFGNLKK